MILNAILGGYLGRMGGKGGPFPINTKLRDLGVPVFFAFALSACPWFIATLCAIILFPLLTLGYGEKSPLYHLGKWEFATLGLIYSLAGLPFSIYFHAFAAQGLFSILCAASVWALHEYRFILSPYFLGDAADFEEFFRYFSLILLAGVLL